MSKEFFIPKTTVGGRDNLVADQIIEQWQPQYNNKITSAKCYSLKWVHDGKIHSATVGEEVDEKFGNGLVYLITYNAQGFYLIFTANRGIFFGNPIMAGAGNIQNAEFFT